MHEAAPVANYMSHNVYVTMYRSQVLGKGGNEKVGDGMIWICHKVYVTMYTSIAAYMLHVNLKKKLCTEQGMAVLNGRGA